MPPQATREAVLFILTREAHVHFRLFADRVVESGCELVSVVRPQHAVDVVVLTKRNASIWRGEEIQERSAEWTRTGTKIAAGGRISGTVRTRIAGHAVSRAAGGNEDVANARFAEITRALFERWDAEQLGSLVNLLAIEFVADEEKQLVAIVVKVGPGQEHRAADVSAGVVVLALRTVDDVARS